MAKRKQAKIDFSKKPLLMGVLNVTPDSFSDGGKYNNIETALKHALELEKQGADIIDIGGESTGPGSKDVKLKEELRRVIPVIKAIREKSDILISIDTWKSEVAEKALKAGANIINDITAMRGDPKIADLAAKHSCPIILMYSKDSGPRTGIRKKKYSDIIKTIKTFWQKRIDFAQKKGIDPKNIILDPGMGHFVSALPEYSFEIILRLRELTSIGYPILIGISRKSFLGGQLSERDKLTLAPTSLAILNGAAIIRTHNLQNAKPNS